MRNPCPLNSGSYRGIQGHGKEKDNCYCDFEFEKTILNNTHTPNMNSTIQPSVIVLVQVEGLLLSRVPGLYPNIALIL